MNLHISRGVSKLGVDIPSINLPPVVTCRCDAPCADSHKCYAMKGRFAFQHNKNLLQGNLDMWQHNPEQFEIGVRAAAFHSRFVRWHSSGDIPDEAYLEMMVRIAEKLPDTKFLCFTKKFELVNEYLDIHKVFPENLRMVFSAWGSFIPENPHNLPMAYVRFKKSEQNNIPSTAFQCQNYCGDCVMSGCSCWDLKNGEAVCFNEH